MYACTCFNSASDVFFFFIGKYIWIICGYRSLFYFLGVKHIFLLLYIVSTTVFMYM